MVAGDLAGKHARSVTPVDVTRLMMEAERRAPEPADLLPLTLPEVRRLLWQLWWCPWQPAPHSLHWSRWRRRHQARAQRCHYRRRLARLNYELRL